jgi:hypothetical protein
MIFLTTGCRNSTESDDSLPAGKAVVKIDTDEFYGSASIAIKILNENPYQSITLELNDSINIEILSNLFHTGKFFWPYELYSTTIIFSLQYHYFGGTAYAPDSGWVLIQTVTPFQIDGAFDLKIFDLAASCMGCPGTYKYITGEFKAIKI